MSKWEMVKLGKIGKIVTGNTPSTKEKMYYENDDIPFYKPSDLNEKSITILEIPSMFLDNRAEKKLRILPKNSVLVTCIGIIGKVAVTKSEKSATNQQINAIIPYETKIDSQFLAYALFKRKKYLQDKANAPVVPIINKSDFSETEIPLPPLEVQKQIADELDRITDLIEKRKQQIEKLDLLVKSRFIEMFGDPVMNPMGWDISRLEEVSLKITDGKHGGCNVLNEDTGYFFIGAREVANGKINYINAPKISKEEFEKDYKRCNIENGDFIIVNTGATIGKSAVLFNENTTKTLLQKSVALIKPEKNTLNSMYLKLCYQINTNMYKVDSASAQPNLLLSRIKKTEIMLPPLHLQTQFADFVTQVDKSKFGMKQSLEKLEILKKALMQEYFG